MLIMAVLPVALTVAYYSEISNQLSSWHSVTAANPTDDGSVSAMQHDDHCQQNKTHPAGCTFHVCVDCAIASSFEFIFTFNGPPYSHPQQTGSISIIAPRDIKPPIVV
jgi:hypothetical protein